jgi:hypothetical protein
MVDREHLRFRQLLLHRCLLVGGLDDYFFLDLLRPYLCSNLSFLLVLPHNPLVLGITS